MIKVLKFGGTSVGSPANIKKVTSIVKDEKATVVVLSAMSGTTDSLVKICAAAKDMNEAAVEEQLDMLIQKYNGCIEGLLGGDALAKAKAAMDQSFDVIRENASGYRQYVSERIILSQGELLTSAIFALYLQQSGIKSEWLDALDFMQTDAQDKVDTEALHNVLRQRVTDPQTIYVTQGFICKNYRGEIDNLGRGGSDYSAALIGAAIGAQQVQIWTDIDGMHNNDPRFVENTHPIRHMSFDEAAELAYFGAKILHPSTILPCKEKGIPVLLRNTMDPAALGTTISSKNDDLRIFHAVAAKDNITVIRIHSARMLMAYGFLRKVFEVFESYRTPIDMITTSEVAVSLTIDNDSHLAEIEKDLKALGNIEIEKNNTIVCVVGNMAQANGGLTARILDAMQEIPVKMISYGASDHSMVILIDTKHKKFTLQALNDNLF